MRQEQKSPHLAGRLSEGEVSRVYGIAETGSASHARQH